MCTVYNYHSSLSSDDIKLLILLMVISFISLFVMLISLLLNAIQIYK